MIIKVLIFKRLVFILLQKNNIKEQQVKVFLNPQKLITVVCNNCTPVIIIHDLFFRAVVVKDIYLYGHQLNIFITTHDLFFRAVVVKGLYLYGHPVMVAVLWTVVTVMGIPTVYSLCQSVVPQNMEHAPGTWRSVLLH